MKHLQIAVGIIRDAEQRIFLTQRAADAHMANKWEFAGGKFEAGETAETALKRELQEEVGIQSANLVCRAELRFVEQQGPQWLGYAFTTRDFTGVPAQSAEADPFWCRCADIPYDRMWDDDRLWLPLILAQEQCQQNGLLIADLLFREGRLLDHVVDSSRRLAPALEV